MSIWLDGGSETTIPSDRVFAESSTIYTHSNWGLSLLYVGSDSQLAESWFEIIRKVGVLLALRLHFDLRNMKLRQLAFLLIY